MKLPCWKVKYLKMFNYSESITNTSLCRSNAQVLLVKTSDVSIYTWSLLHMETNGPSCRTAYLSICIGWFILSRLFSPKTPCFLSVAWTCWWAVNWLIPGVLLSAGHLLAPSFDGPHRWAFVLATFVEVDKKLWHLFVILLPFTLLYLEVGIRESQKQAKLYVIL